MEGHTGEGFLRLCICPPPGESLPLLRLKHPQIFPSTISGKEARHCIVAPTFLWRTGHLDQGWGVAFFCLFVLLYCFLVVSVGKRRPFSKPLPFQICPGLNSGDSKPHLPTSWSRPELSVLYAQILCASAESLHRWSASAWEVNSQSVLGLPLLANRRALLTRAHFLLSDLTLDSPKIEPLVRCVLSSPSRQWKQHLSCSSES